MAALAALGIDPSVAAVYQANRPGASVGGVLCALVTDRFFRLHTLAAVEGRPARPRSSRT